MNFRTLYNKNFLLLKLTNNENQDKYIFNIIEIIKKFFKLNYYSFPSMNY